VERFYVEFGDPSCIGFWDIVRQKNRQAERTEIKKRLKAHDLIASIPRREVTYMRRMCSTYVDNMMAEPQAPPQTGTDCTGCYRSKAGGSQRRTACRAPVQKGYTYSHYTDLNEQQKRHSTTTEPGLGVFRLLGRRGSHKFRGPPIERHH